MKRYKTILLILPLLLLSGGCVSYRPPLPDLFGMSSSTIQSSQTLIQTSDHERLWEAIAEAVSRTFTIASEEPVQVYDNILTEGRMETEPKIASSIFEPWHDDSTTLAARVEATYQTLRKKAIIRVIPDSNGFLVTVAVLVEMEDLDRPIESNASGTFIKTTSQTDRVVDASNSQSNSKGWFQYDHDTDLEKVILEQIVYRFNNPSKVIRRADVPLFN